MSGPQARPAPRSVSLAQIRDAALELVETYERTEGVSPSDDYDPAPRVHPMAEAKYLMACVALVEAGILSASTVRHRARGSLTRLQVTDVGGSEGVSAWGLGFSFRDLPPAEPFTITTLLVVESLARVRPLLDGDAADDCDALVAGGLRWLTEVLPRVTEDGVAFPAYSLGLPVAANNVAAYWSGVVSTLTPEGDPRRAEAQDVATAVLRRYVDGVGWTYEKTSPRVDLVHTCYIGHGLLGALPDQAEVIERRAVTAVLQFAGPMWVDRFDVHALGGAFDLPQVRAATVARVTGDSLLTGFDVPARSWSMGEAMVLFGELAGRSRRPEFHRAHGRGLAGRVLVEYLPESRYRHSMHLAHGLAVVVREARKAAAV